MRILFLGALLSIPVTAFSSECGQWHNVKRGESISIVAQKMYGDANAYDRIYQANLEVIGDNPSNINVGARIYIPCEEIAQPQFDEWFHLPEPSDLANMHKVRDIQIIDIRAADKTNDEFVPDSVLAPFKIWRGPSDNPGQPPSNEELGTLLGEYGIRLDQPTVIVHGKDNPMSMGRAAFVYWLLKSAGAEQIGILSGGFDGWKASGLAMADAPIERDAYEARVTLSDTWRASPEEVEAIASGETPGTLVDARPKGIFAKLDKAGNPKATTLPGAVSISGPASFNTYKTTADHGLSVLERLKGMDVNWQTDPIINFCNQGEIGALNWFYASELSGIRNVKLYPESSHGWKYDGNELAAGEVVEIFRR